MSDSQTTPLPRIWLKLLAATKRPGEQSLWWSKTACPCRVMGLQIAPGVRSTHEEPLGFFAIAERMRELTEAGRGA